MQVGGLIYLPLWENITNHGIFLKTMCVVHSPSYWNGNVTINKKNFTRSRMIPIVIFLAPSF